MTTVFCTIAEEQYMPLALHLQASAAYFHPEIPFRIVPPPVDYAIAKSFVIHDLLQHYDRVICFDADSIIVAPLTELLESWCDITTVRNNNDYGKAGCEDGITQVGTDVQDYLNGGLISVVNRNFLLEWMLHDTYYAKHMAHGSQTIFNALCLRYDTRILDPIEAPYYYGVSGLYGTHTHWDSWKDIYLQGPALMLGNKQVKVLHHAGGAVEGKLDFNLFHHSVRQRLIEICGQQS